MFGGLAFLIRGNMAIAASSEGGALVRVDPAQSDALVAMTTATPITCAAGTCPDGCGSAPAICAPTTSSPTGVEIGTGYVRLLPPKIEACRSAAAANDRYDA